MRSGAIDIILHVNRSVLRGEAEIALQKVQKRARTSESMTQGLPALP
jgi:hypothetical protein